MEWDVMAVKWSEDDRVDYVSALKLARTQVEAL
jgi:hypothetical protein